MSVTTPTVILPRVAATTARADLVRGAKAMLPWLVGVVPFGLIVGITVSSSSIDHAAGLATGPTIYSGSAQLAAVSLLDSGAAPVVAITTVLAINARLVFYSASMAPRWRSTRVWYRAAASYLLVDPSYAVGDASYEEHPDGRSHLHYLGAGVTLWVAWHAAITIGFVAGTGVPDALQLEHAIPLFLVAEVGHRTRGRPALVAAAVGALVAAVGTGLPLHIGPLLGIAAGLTAADVVHRRSVIEEVSS